MNDKREELKRNYKLIESVIRVYCGLSQLIFQPWKNIFILAVAVIFGCLWNEKEKILEYMNIPSLMKGLFEPMFSFLLIVLFVLILLFVLKTMGRWYARKDENRLIVAFTSTDLRNGYPILISRKKQKRENVTVTRREYYSFIPKKRWEEMKDAIQDDLNITLVEPEITYGGRKQNKGNRIVIHSIPGRKYKEWGTLYDKEL